MEHEAAETTRADDSSLLDVRRLSVEFARPKHAAFRAVDGVSFSIRPGETVGLVGESGSGKSTTGRAILGLAPVSNGSIRFLGREISRVRGKERRALSRQVQVVFQDPYSSLNPARTIGQSLAEMLHGDPDISKAGRRTRAVELLERVGIDKSALAMYPSQFSGGQRQRIAIARALMPGPRLVICDEPVSALDLSVQAQVLNLLRELQRNLGISYLFIGHDLSVVEYLAHRTLVLYKGRIVESGPVDVVHHQPRHPYTQTLLAATPALDPAVQARRRRDRTKPQRVTDETGEPFTNGTTDAGDTACPFVARCPLAQDQCEEQRPEAQPTDVHSVVACHRWRDTIGAVDAEGTLDSCDGEVRQQTKPFAPSKPRPHSAVSFRS